MSSSSPTSPSSSPPLTLKKLHRVRSSVRAGLNAAAARRPRVRRRPRAREYDSPKRLPSPAESHASNSGSLSVNAARRRRNVANTLLNFPEHDASTVAALLNHYHDDTDLVFEKLARAREHALQTTQPSGHVSNIVNNLANLPNTPVHTQSSPPFSQFPPSISSPNPNPSPTNQHPNRQYQQDRAAASLASFAASPPAVPQPVLSPTTPSSVSHLQLITPRHRRQRSKRLSDATAPLWEAIGRPASSDASSVASSAGFGSSATGRVVGTKRGRSESMRMQEHVGLGHIRQESSEEPMTEGEGEGEPVFGGEAFNAFQGTSPGLGRLETREKSSSAHVLDSLPPDIAEIDAVRMLVRRLVELEAAFEKFQRESISIRQGLHGEVKQVHLAVKSVEKTHENLGHELDENQKQVSKIEQYLDIMRKDVINAIRRGQSTFVVIVRAGMNNLFYYVLAYLVPIFAFLIRAVRDLWVWLRHKPVEEGEDEGVPLARVEMEEAD